MISKLRTSHYKNCKLKCRAASVVHIVNRFFFTNRNVAGPIELWHRDDISRFKSDTLTFSHSTVRIKLKFLLHTKL